MNDRLAKAYIEDDFIIATIEIRHESFVEDDKPYALRVVNDNQNFEGAIEHDAPIDPGEMVLFKSCPFQVTRPEKGNLIPSLSVRVDDVSLILRPYLLKAMNFLSPIVLVYREYLESVPEPQMIYNYRVLKTTGSGTVEFVGEMINYYNRKILTHKISIDEFPGLSR